MKNDVSNIQSNGKTTYNKNILLSIINLAAKEVSGVSSMCANFGASWFAKLFSNNYYEGVKISNSPRGLVIDVYINVYANYAVNDVACRAQENIKRSIETMADVETTEVNVHVLGVQFNETDKNRAPA